MVSLRVTKAPSELLALSNCVFINPDNFKTGSKYVIINGMYRLTLRHDSTIPLGYIGTASVHRGWMQLALNDDVQVVQFDPMNSFDDADRYCLLGTLTVEVGFLKKSTQTAQTFDTEHLAAAFQKNFGSQIFSTDQSLVMEFGGHNLVLRIHEVARVEVDQAQDDDPENQWGLLMEKTVIKFFGAEKSTIKLVGSIKSTANPNAILQSNFKLEDMRIGGLDAEFSTIFRRAFASRIYPPSIAKKMGMVHVKGVLLHGPPGTGKTLIARQIGKMLNAREPKIVNGPEILNKYVGQSEENVRNLFKDAEVEYKAKGENSQLHIIIFDELDAICKQRGARSDSTGVGDSVVNQLLSKMDGVDQLNNILIIGMTNRLDLIDEALLRPGRLEVHIEIGLPDESGRLQILKIHTTELRTNGMLEEDVDLSEISMQAKNFTGAELCGLIRSAESHALTRHIKVGTMAAVDEDSVESMKVSREDFFRAFEEVHAAFGVSDDQFSSCGLHGIINFSKEIDIILEQGMLCTRQVMNGNGSSLISLLLHGPPGSGKTSLAAKIAVDTEFAFVKKISAEDMIGLSESARISAISKVFSDAYKSPISVIVVDAIERLLDYVPIGPRFSNSILQTLIVLLKKVPPKGRRMLVISTTSYNSVLEEMGMGDCFSNTVYVPNISHVEEVEAVVNSNSSMLSPEDCATLLSQLRRQVSKREFSVSVKKLLELLEKAAQDRENAVMQFMLSFAETFIAQDDSSLAGPIGL